MQGRLRPPRARRADLVHERVEVLGLGDGQGLDLGQAAFGQPAEHAAGTQFDQRCQSQPGKGFHRLAPAHGAAQLRREEAGPFGGVVVHVCVHVGDDADLWREEGHRRQRLAQLSPRALHEGRMERARNLDGHDPPGAEALGQVSGEPTASGVPAITTWPGAL